MKMTSALAGLGLFVASLNAHGVAIFFDPAAQSVDLGDQVFVDVVIEDLGDFAPQSLSTFDLDVLFDDTLLNFAGVTYGNGLDQGIFGSITGDFSFPGGHNVFEASLEDASDLIAGQPASFVLFTLTFDTLDVGTSPLSLTIQNLDDEQLPPVSIPAETRTGSIQINGPVQVPEPTPLALLAFGLVVFGTARRTHLSDLNA